MVADEHGGEEGSGRLAEIAGEHGIHYVDAPVLGTKQPAEQGQLIVLASGPEEVTERSEQVFSALGSKTVWLGEAGEGSRLKLVVNNWIVGLLGVLAETVAFAEATGVDPAKFLETIEGGPLGLPYAQIKGSMMVEEDFRPAFRANSPARTRPSSSTLQKPTHCGCVSPSPLQPASMRRYRQDPAKKTWRPSIGPQLTEPEAWEYNRSVNSEENMHD